MSRPPCAHSIKTVLCCADLAASMAMYHDLLGLPLVEQWDQEEGRGAILAVGPASFLELAAPARGGEGHRPVFDERVANDKIILQLRVDSTREWAEYLRGRCEFEGPTPRPWGNTYLYLRDPDGVRVALYEGDAASVEWSRRHGMDPSP